MLQTANNKIQRGFNRAAVSYDRSSGLHRQIADALWAQIPPVPAPSALLDVGCGTGYLTIKAREFFPKAQIIGLDLSQDMLNIAAAKREDISWVMADGMKLPFSDGKFDKLISNLAYQWVGDLPQAFTEARRVLSTSGLLSCTLFGFNTCQELFQALDEAKPGAVQYTRLRDESEVKEALALSGFKDPLIDSEQIKVPFKDMYELIGWLKSIGANNLAREGYAGREAMARAGSIYSRRFACPNGVAATFEMIRIYVKK